MEYVVDMTPVRVGARERHPCQGYRCPLLATWNRWGGRYCYDHAVRAGWLPGVVRQRGTQLGLS